MLSNKDDKTTLFLLLMADSEKGARADQALQRNRGQQGLLHLFCSCPEPNYDKGTDNWSKPAK
jgi:hypothetical protein